MPRNRLHASAADRQRAYRQRVAERWSGPPAVQPLSDKRKRSPSRPARLSQLLRDVQALAAEYEDWLTALPEPLQNSSVADKLSETIEQLNGKRLVNPVHRHRIRGRSLVDSRDHGEERSRGGWDSMRVPHVTAHVER